MQSQFNAAINQLVAEKNLPREIVEDIKSAFKAACKDLDTEIKIDVELSESGEMATVSLTVEEEDENLEISLEEALKYINQSWNGFNIDVTPMEYGRIAAQSAKQVIIQKLQEAERDIMYAILKIVKTN